MLTAPQVVLLFSALTIGSMGLLLVFVARRYIIHIKGMTEWGAGLLLVSSTIVTALLVRETLGILQSIVIAQIIVLIALLMVNHGLRRFFEVENTYSITTIGVFLGIFIIAVLWVSWIQPSYEGRSILFMLGGSIVLVDMVRLTLAHRNDGAGVRILSVSLLALLAVRIVKLATALLGLQPSESLLEASSFQLILLVMPSVLVPLATLAFMLMGSEKLVYRLNRMIRHDDLTGALNKSSLYTELEREIPRSVRYRHPLSLMMIDLDNFKAINDRHGHLQGDATLKKVVDQIQSCVRGTDLVARFGGDEFAVLLTETDIDASKLIAQRVLSEIQNTLPADCGASIGISALRSHGETPESLLHRADHALYKAKLAGKNQLALA